MLEHILKLRCSSNFDQLLLVHVSEVFLIFTLRSLHPFYETKSIALAEWCHRMLVLLNVMLFPFYVEIQYEAILRAQLLLIIKLLGVMSQAFILV